MKKKLISTLLACALVCSMTACGGSEEKTTQDANSAANTIQTETTSGNIYIGMLGKTMTEYPCQNSDNMTPEMLISTIAGMTGWNLDLADAVTEDENGGLKVCFASTSSLFTGLPQEQVEEFAVANEEELITTILDSIQYTLQQNFADGESDSVNIYYSMEGNQPLDLSLIGKSVSMDQPYTGLDESVNAAETQIVTLEE
jgi:hypothetical protein